MGRGGGKGEEEKDARVAEREINPGERVTNVLKESALTIVPVVVGFVGLKAC